MKEQYVRMSFYKIEQGDLIPTSAWDVSMGNGIVGTLQNWAWKFLLKTKAARIHFDKSQLITSIAINKDKLARVVIQECIGRLRYSATEPTKILIGPDKFMELMGPMGIEPWEMSPFSIDTEAKVGFGSSYKIMGLSVQVVPHMVGILVL